MADEVLQPAPASASVAKSQFAGDTRARCGRRPKRGAAGRASRHDRGLRRRLRHHRLWRLRLVHERQYDPDRLPGRRGRVWPGVGVGVGDPVLLRWRVCGRIVRGTRWAPRAAPCLHLRRGDARGDHRPDAASASSRPASASRSSVSQWASSTARSPASARKPVSLTFVTGTLSRVGSHLALAVRRAPLTDSQGPWDTHLRRALILARVWAGFIAGAIFAGAATPRFGAWVLSRSRADPGRARGVRSSGRRRSLTASAEPQGREASMRI